MPAPWEEYAAMRGAPAGPWQQYAAMRTQPEEMNLDPTAGNSFAQNALIGAGKAVSDVWRGLSQFLGVGDQAALREEVAESRRLDAPLMKTAGGMTGNLAAQLSTALIPGAAGLRGAALIGAGTGAVQPTIDGESRLGNIVTGAALGAAGQKVGEKATSVITGKLGERAAERVAAQSMNTPRDAALAVGKQAGLVVPPTQVNPTLLNRSLEGLAGKLTTGQAASAKNAPVINRMVANALGLPADEPITRTALARIRTQAGQAYEAVKGTGTVQADQQLTSALDQLVAKYQGAGKAFPGLAKNEVAELVDTLRVPRFDADAGVDAISVLREKADAAYSAGNKALGKAARGAADALEDQMGRHLQATGAPAQLLDEYRQARQLIAKTYSVDGALNPSGNIDASKLATALKRGAPLTAELKDVANFASVFPKAAQPVERMGSLPGISPLDAGLALSQGNLGKAASWLVGRPAARAAIISDPYQRVFAAPSYSAPVIDRAAQGVVKDDRLTRALQALTASGYFASQR